MNFRLNVVVRAALAGALLGLCAVAQAAEPVRLALIEGLSGPFANAGEAVAQGFLHNFAGLTTFAIALVSIYVFDQLCQKITGRRAPGRAV